MIRLRGQCNFLNSKSNNPNVFCNGITALLFSAAVQFNQLCYVRSTLISVPENSLHQHPGILLMSVKKKKEKTAKEIISHPERSSRLCDQQILKPRVSTFRGSGEKKVKHEN